METIERRVLEILASHPRGSLFRDEEREAVERLALFIWHPVTDVYEMPDGSVTARITDEGRRELAKARERELVGIKSRHSPPQGSEGHSGATESTSPASSDAAVRPANSDAMDDPSHPWTI